MSARPEPADLPCHVFVELVTDYLDGALDPAGEAQVDAHLALCPHCVEVLDQWRAVVVLAGRLGDEQVEALDGTTRSSLVDAFAAARRARPRD